MDSYSGTLYLPIVSSLEMFNPLNSFFLAIIQFMKLKFAMVLQNCLPNTFLKKKYCRKYSELTIIFNFGVRMKSKSYGNLPKPDQRGWVSIFSLKKKMNPNEYAPSKVIQTYCTS